MKVLVSFAVSVLGSVIEREGDRWKVCQTEIGRHGVIQSEHPLKGQFCEMEILNRFVRALL